VHPGRLRNVPDRLKSVYSDKARQRHRLYLEPAIGRADTRQPTV
jgi:hypothetical protein